MRKLILLGLAALLLVPATSQASIVFDGRNFGVTGATYPNSGNCAGTYVPLPAICPWSQLHIDKEPANTGNKSTVVTSPVVRAGRESAQIDLIPIPLGTSERVQYRAEPVAGLTNVQGQDWWHAFSVQMPVGYNPGPDFNSFYDAGTKFNNECSGSAGQGGSQGAAVPEIYYHTPTNRWYFKIAGGLGSTIPYQCNIRTNQLPLTGFTRGAWYQFLVHFKYSATAAGLPVTELFYRVSPALAWTQADLNGTLAGLADNKPNLVVRSPYTAGVMLHHGFYKPDESQDVTLRAYFAGLVIATTRAEAEAAAF